MSGEVLTSDKRGINTLAGFVVLWVAWRLYWNGTLAILLGYLPFVGLEASEQAYQLATGRGGYGSTAGAIVDVVLILAEGLGGAAILIGTKIWDSIYRLALIARRRILELSGGEVTEPAPVEDPLLITLQEITAAIDAIAKRVDALEPKK